MQNCGGSTNASKPGPIKFVRIRVDVDHRRTIYSHAFINVYSCVVNMSNISTGMPQGVVVDSTVHATMASLIVSSRQKGLLYYGECLLLHNVMLNDYLQAILCIHLQNNWRSSYEAYWRSTKSNLWRSYRSSL